MLEAPVPMQVAEPRAPLLQDDEWDEVSLRHARHVTEEVLA